MGGVEDSRLVRFVPFRNSETTLEIRSVEGYLFSLMRSPMGEKRDEGGRGKG